MIYLFSENKIVINPYHKYFQAPKTSADFSTEVLIRRSPPASQGYKDSNLEMSQSPLPYRLAIALCRLLDEVYTICFRFAIPIFKKF